MLPYGNQLIINGTIGVMADSSVKWNFDINSHTKQPEVDYSSFQSSVFELELSNVVTQVCQMMLPYKNQLTINGDIGVVADSSVRWNFNINSHTNKEQGVPTDDQSSSVVSEFSSSGMYQDPDHKKDLILQVSSPTCNSFGSNSDEMLIEGSSSAETAVNDIVIKTEPPSESYLDDPCNTEHKVLPMSLTAAKGLVPSAIKRVEEPSTAELVQRKMNTFQNDAGSASASDKGEEIATYCVKQEPCDSLPLKVRLPVKKRKPPPERSKGETELNKNDLKLPKARPYKCDVCNRCFEIPSELKRHARVHTEEPYKCETCGKVFKSRSSIFKHRSVHTGEKPFTCEVCGKTFRTRDIFKMHERIHQGEKPHMCKFCGKSFTQSSHMHRHERTHTGEKPYQCDVCGKSFRASHTARTHKKNVHGNKGKVHRRHNCRFCGLSFDEEIELISHKLEHAGPKEFKCDMCEKEFQTEYTLQKHVEKMHDLPRFVCEMCGKSYATNQGLGYHKETHFGGQPKKQFQCPHCPKAFRCKSVLQNHQVSHTGERPFPCQLCDTKLTRYSNLLRHYEQVHKQKRAKDWVCKICGESFLSQWLMKLHNKTHAAGDTLEVAAPREDTSGVPPSGESENSTVQHSLAPSSAFGSDGTMEGDSNSILEQQASNPL